MHLSSSNYIRDRKELVDLDRWFLRFFPFCFCFFFFLLTRESDTICPKFWKLPSYDVQ